MAKSSPILWVWYMYQFDKYRPTTEKFLQSRWHHYHFCKRRDINISAALYLDTLADEIRDDLLKDKATYLKTLTYHSFLNALTHPETRKEIDAFFEQEEISVEDIRGLQERVNEIRNPAANATDPSPTEAGIPSLTEAAHPSATADLYAKTYVVATHLHFELAGKEAEYDVLSRQMPKLEEFIRETFKPRRLPGTLAKLRGYSYKKIIQGKNTGEKGQLKPVFRQIIDNPQIFREPVSQYADNLLKKYFDD